ncbi:hypothetical protein PLANTIT3_90082 [Plantibacter sp. T3]|nr:hypothetical protein PLANTIT3_90082 [Plantibacter sp. T3]
MDGADSQTVEGDLVHDRTARQPTRLRLGLRPPRRRPPRRMLCTVQRGPRLHGAVVDPHRYCDRRRRGRARRLHGVLRGQPRGGDREVGHRRRGPRGRAGAGHDDPRPPAAGRRERRGRSRRRGLRDVR